MVSLLAFVETNRHSAHINIPVVLQIRVLSCDTDVYLNMCSHLVTDVIKNLYSLRVIINLLTFVASYYSP